MNFGAIDLSGLARDPQSVADAIRAVTDDPRHLVGSVALVTRLGAYTKNPWAPAETTQGGPNGEGGLNELGVLILRGLKPRLVIVTAAGPIEIDLTP